LESNVFVVYPMFENSVVNLEIISTLLTDKVEGEIPMLPPYLF